jgi:hypothetical protein
MSAFDAAWLKAVDLQPAQFQPFDVAHINDCYWAVSCLTGFEYGMRTSGRSCVWSATDLNEAVGGLQKRLKRIESNCSIDDIRSRSRFASSTKRS